MMIAYEAYYNKRVLPQILANVVCRTTAIWTPLLLIYYDERMRFSHYKSVKEKTSQCALVDNNLVNINRNTKIIGENMAETAV